MLLQFSFSISSFVFAKAESQETESCQTHGLCSLPKEHGRARPQGPPAQLRPPPPTPICSPRHWGRGGPTAGVSGPARHAWGGPGSRSRRGLKKKLGTAEVARETRRAERAAAASPAPPPRPGLLGKHAAPSARQPATRRRRAALVRSRRGAPAGSPAPVLRHQRRAPPRAGAVGGGTLAAATLAPARLRLLRWSK